MNKVLRTLIFFFYTFSFSTTHAQQWKAYSSFSQANCFFTAQDSTLWIGTDGGAILHYDKDYKLMASYDQNDGSDSLIHSIVQDIDGNIWASYYNGYSRASSKSFIFDGNNWIDVSNLGKALITDKPLLFYAKDGSSWISYDKASKFVQVGKDSVYTSYDWVNQGIAYFRNEDLMVNSQGHFWISYGASFLSFNGKKWVTYNANSSLPLPESYYWGYNNAIIDYDNNIFFTTFGHEGIFKFNTISKESTIIPFKNIWINKIFAKRSNKIMVSVDDTNPQIYQLEENKFSVLIHDINVHNFYEDFQGNLILSGYNQMDLFDGNKLKPLTLPPLLLPGKVISSVSSDSKNNIWISYYTGIGLQVVRMNEKNNEISKLLENLVVTSFAQGEGNDFWLSTYDSIIQVKQDKGTEIIKYPLYIGYKSKIICDKNKHIWVLAHRHSWITNQNENILYHYDKHTWTTFNLENQIIDMAASPNGGIYLLNTKEVFTHDGINLKASNYLNIPKNPQRFVSNANLDLYIIAKKSENYEGDIYQLVGNKFDKIATPDEFRIIGYIWDNDFMIDSKGNFWSVGNKIQRYDGKTLTTFNRPFRSTNPDYFSTITNAIHESKDGKIWLGSYTGLSSLTLDCKNPLPTSLRTEKTDGFGTGKSQLSVNQSSALSFAWQISKDRGTTWRAITNFDSSYAGHRTNQLTVNQVKIRDNNIVYRCLVNGECNSVLSDTVSIQAKQCELPQTTLQPTVQTTTEKSSAQFFINVSGASAYQWQVSTDKGVTWNMIASNDTLYRGQQSNVLNIVSAYLSQNTYQYRCEIKNDCYTIYSTAAPLEVTMILGIDNFERTVQAYPNPANDKIYVKVPAKTYTLTLVDSNGSIVKQVSNQDYINVEDISNGLYLLLIESGKERQSVKVQVLK